MKKIVFTVQVLSIIAAFPLYVITELNHGSSRLSETSTKVSEAKEMQGSKILSDTTVAFEMQYLAFKKSVTQLLKAIN